VSDKWQGVFKQTAPEETDPQAACLAKGCLPAIVQRGAEIRAADSTPRRNLSPRDQLNPPARSCKELPAYFFLQ
jgi:hypothetical protein